MHLWYLPLNLANMLAAESRDVFFYDLPDFENPDGRAQDQDADLPDGPGSLRFLFFTARGSDQIPDRGA